MLNLRTLFFSLVLVLGTVTASAQNLPEALASAPERMELLGLSVEGVEDEYTRGFVQQTSGLAIGQELVLPGDPAISDAIRAIYRLGSYDDVQIIEERRVGNGVYIALRVREVPKLSEYVFEGVKKGDRKDLREEAPLILRAPVRPASIARTEQVIREFYREKGRPLATVEVERTLNPDNTMSLRFNVDRGPKARVGDIVINGNEQLSDRALYGAMETKKKVWWRFWRRAKFKEDEYDGDLGRILSKYSEEGFYDAQVLRDSVYLDLSNDNKPRIVVAVDVREGPKYFIRDIQWDGNALFSDEVLSERLGLKKGDAYNGTRLELNLYGNKNSTDIASLYLNRGYMRFNAQPEIRVVGEDSLDLRFDVLEGDAYRYGTITINGNTKTKEHVVRRELYTIPGNTFSREEIQESIRRLMQLSYFTPESLGAGPGIDVREEDKSVDLNYNLEETGSDQLELSGTWGRFGLILQLRFGFNNFSAQNIFNRKSWRPLPAGDGQKLSVGIQTNGRRYQQYSLSFTEPWFRGRPTPIGFSTSFSRISSASFLSSTSGGNLVTFSGNVFYERRLKWPDDFFSMGTSIGFQHFNNDQWLSTLPNGISRQITIRQTLTRSSINNPLFPTAGSKFLLSLELSPPIGNFIQYHKWRLNTAWNAPLTKKLSISIASDYGLIGSLTGEDVAFERFIVGGSPFETQGFYNYFGKDVVYMRGYPIAALGPREDDDPVGGRILNKYATELRLMAVQSQQLQAAPYLFFDAANTWDGFRSYNPTDLFRSAGMGVRLFLPILGMVELAYGYNFDEFAATSRHPGSNKWTFQFSLGQGFGQ